MGLGRIQRGWEGIKVSADEAMQKLLETAQLGAGGRMGPDHDGPGIAKAQLPPIQEKHRKAVQFMIDYIHKHYAEDLTLEQLASQLYISKNYLNQLFKKVTGETFTNYVIRVRIERAKALLLEGNHLIYEVSEMVGYQNVPYFSTLFKKYCSVSPSEMMKFRS
ncbi:helix-turn-helix domain-containing protein [Paenibacillus oralis]|uniref:Helix-turn-helix domain-containing protein n=1 Tax=Paenibacillus oralis TaxID=2490856 RepID=A0A3P3U672_9BACL|nr:helix-turn-helix domain-containing protein [Paenibacillus oralis]